jgi:hypothetical protein
MDKVSMKDSMSVRNIILGSGGIGLLAKCYLTFYKEKFQSLYHVCDFDNSDRVAVDKKNQLKLVA